MTVTTTTITDSYTGDNSTTNFATTFPFKGTGASAELEVIERTIATGAEVTKTYTTHYTVTGGSGSTGTVIAVSAPADTVEWHLRRKTTQTQTTDYVANDPFAAETHEGALDRLAMVQQEQQADIDASSKFPDTYTGGASAALPEPSADKYLAWNSGATALENKERGPSLLNGSGAPSAGTGIDGDFYLDTSSNDIYGPKTAGAWGSGTSIIGPTGATGATGPTGPVGVGLALALGG